MRLWLNGDTDALAVTIFQQVENVPMPYSKPLIAQSLMNAFKHVRRGLETAFNSQINQQIKTPLRYYVANLFNMVPATKA